MYVFGSQSFIYGTISNCGNYSESILCYGAGYKSDIYNVKSIYASGYNVLYEVIVFGTRELYITATEGLSGSSITTSVSGPSHSDEVRFEIAGINQEYYDVYCGSGDICTICCQSSESCTTMILYCFGTCYVDCDGVDRDCPTLASGSFNVTNCTDNYDINSNACDDPISQPSLLPATLPCNHTHSISNITKY